MIMGQVSLLYHHQVSCLFQNKHFYHLYTLRLINNHYSVLPYKWRDASPDADNTTAALATPREK